MAPAERVRIAVIGAGSVAQQMHLPYLAELSDRFEVVGVCDASATLAARAAAPFGASSTTDHRRLLELAPDAVLISTNGPSEELTLDALDAGVHVFAEKPLAWNADWGRRIEDAVARSGKVLLIGYMKRYDPAVELAQTLLGELGDVRGGLVRCVAGPNESYIDEVAQIVRADDLPAALADPQARSARMRERAVELLGEPLTPDLLLAYGLLYGITCHELSVMRGLLGAPSEVVAAQVWDEGRWIAATLRYEHGSLQYLLGRVATRSFDERIELYSERQTLSLSFPSPFLKHAPTLLTRTSDRADGSSVEERAIASYEEAFKRELEHFHDCVAHGAEPRTPAAEGTGDAEIMTAIVRAARDGAPQPLTPPAQGAGRNGQQMETTHG